MRPGKLNEPRGLLVSSPYDLSVTPCVCTNSLFRERHGFGASAQSKIVKNANKARFRHRQDTFLTLVRTI